MRILILSLLVAFAASHASADITWNAGRMGPGSMLVMQDAEGAVTHVKRGTQNGLHVFDTYAGTDRTARYIGSYTVTGRGEVTATIAADGAVTSYAPHRCTRTLGTCRFVVTHPDGFVEPRTRVTEATATGLRYREYGLDGLIAEGALDLDGMGVAKKGWRKDGKDKRKVRTKRVRIALK